MLHRRITQFFMIYFLGVGLLLALKYGLSLSDYVIPSPGEIWRTSRTYAGPYLLAVLNTLAVAVLGHIVSICLATAVAIIGRLTAWVGSFIRTAAFNIQAYPIVAVAPIIFILLGDGLASRLLIAAMICYFPLLLSFIGVFSEPVREIEHFYESTGRMTWRLQVKIRAFENVHKLTTVVVGSATLAMVGTIVAEFIAATAGIGYSIRVALYQSDLAKILVALFLIGIGTSLYLVSLEWVGNALQARLKRI
ncbi:MAG TPA: ABC transporter permease subunit [Desulfobacterales bacterium]|jgi:NitT/TauT family transport system permease protein|nr:ABC transporter permease subunit [Desulfobacterales bacterium]HSM90086.1 ABC transporter permease subunit [Desulfobacterales bacterium]